MEKKMFLIGIADSNLKDNVDFIDSITGIRFPRIIISDDPLNDLETQRLNRRDYKVNQFIIAIEVFSNYAFDIIDCIKDSYIDQKSFISLLESNKIHDDVYIITRCKEQHSYVDTHKLNCHIMEGLHMTYKS